MLLSLSPLGPEFQVSPTGGSSQVGAGLDGAFVVAYTGSNSTQLFARLFAPDATPITDPMRVNPTIAATNESTWHLAVADNGNFTVVWTRRVTSTNFDVYGRLFAADGSALTDEFLLGATAGFQTSPAVAMDADGDFVATWASDNTIQARRFDMTGAPRGAQFRVDEPAGQPKHRFDVFNPVVAMDDDGDFVVAWNGYLTKQVTKKYYGYAYEVDRFVSDNILIRRYSAGGAAQGPQITVASSTDQLVELNEVKVAMDADGDFIVAWAHDRHKKVGKGYYADYELVRRDLMIQRYNAAGIPQESTLNPASASAPNLIDAFAVAMDPDGNFVVTWGSVDYYKDGRYFYLDEARVLARRYSATGQGLGPTVQINDIFIGTNVVSPSVTVGGNERFIFAWRRAGITGRLFQPAKPDLAGTIGPLVPPALVTGSGGPASVPLIIENIGDAPAVGVIDVALVLSSDDIYGNEDDILLSGLQGLSINIVPGGLRNVTIATSFPNDLSPGQYNLLALIDSGNALTTELSEENNTAFAHRPLIVGDPFNDLEVIPSFRPPGMGTSAIPGDKVQLTARVTNVGNVPVVAQLVDINFYILMMDELADTDQPLASLAGQTITLAPGQFSDFAVHVTLTQAMVPDDYFVIAQVIPAPGFEESDTDNNTAFAADLLTFAYRFGSFDGRRNVPLVLVEDDGTLATFQLKGPGYGEVAIGVLQGFELYLAETTPKSKVKITSRSGGGLDDDGTITLTQVTADAPLRSFIAKTADATESLGFFDGLRSLTLRDVQSAHLQIGSEKGAVKIRLGNVQGLTIESSIRLASLRVGQWLSEDGADLITAPRIQKLVSLGDFQASLSLSRSDDFDFDAEPPKPKLLLGSANIRGALSNAQWDIDGIVGRITTRSFAATSIVAVMSKGANLGTVQIDNDDEEFGFYLDRLRGTIQYTPIGAQPQKVSRALLKSVDYDWLDGDFRIALEPPYDYYY